MSTQTGPLIVIGVGNVLRGDDAVGVRVVEALEVAARAEPGILPPGTQLVDGGTLGLDLLGCVCGSRGLILVDAVRLGGMIGEVHVLDADDLATVGRAPDGVRDAAVGELLAFARLMDWLPTAVALVGVEVGDLDDGLHLSPAVTGAIDAAAFAVRRELRRMAHRPGNETQGGDFTRPVAGATA